MHRPQRFTPQRFGDARGWFSETYSRRQLEAAGIEHDFVQDNHSFSAAKGTLRGLHFQSPPHVQAKLVRCIAGAIWDVAVDLRAGSSSYGRWVGTELTAAGGEQFYIPAGFAHGFITLVCNVEVAYKTSSYYAPECDGGVAWDDPDIAISWPLEEVTPILSDKDRGLPRLRDLVTPFFCDGPALGQIV
jgi:dTDP-4-dehydrorhamnose 3,5-epimerase